MIPHVPETWANEIEHRRKLASSVNLLIQKFALTGTKTLSGSSSTITDDRITEDSIPILIPNDSTAASTTYHCVVTAGTLTITHTGLGDFIYIIIL